MTTETDVSYLSAMYYTAAVLLMLTAVFSALSHSGGIAAIWFILGAGLFVYRLRSSRQQQ